MGLARKMIEQLCWRCFFLILIQHDNIQGIVRNKNERIISFQPLLVMVLPWVPTQIFRSGFGRVSGWASSDVAKAKKLPLLSLAKRKTPRNPWVNLVEVVGVFFGHIEKLQAIRCRMRYGHALRMWDKHYADLQCMGFLNGWFVFQSKRSWYLKPELATSPGFHKLLVAQCGKMKPSWCINRGSFETPILKVRSQRVVFPCVHLMEPLDSTCNLICQLYRWMVSIHMKWYI